MLAANVKTGGQNDLPYNERTAQGNAVRLGARDIGREDRAIHVPGGQVR
jgi:hypothetical protein